MILLTLLLAPSAGATSELPEGRAEAPFIDPPAADHVERTDLAIIDARTGLVEEVVRRGGNGVWDVRVLNVEPSSAGFRLKNPLQSIVFDMGVSTAAGHVEFWHVRLMQGPYSVVQVAGVTEIPVTVFSTLRLGEGIGPPLVRDHTGGSGDSGTPGGTYRTSPHDCLEGVEYQRVNGTQINWTPLLIVNAPWRGTAFASSTFNDAEANYVFAWGWSSTLHTGPGIDATWGETVGVFQLVKWGKVEQLYRRANCATEQRTTFQIIDDAPLGQEMIYGFDLSGPGEGMRKYYSAGDDLTQVSRDGYWSVRFDARYRWANLMIDTRESGFSWTTGRGTSDLWRLGIDLNFPGGSTGAFLGERSTGTTSTYHYEFDSGTRWNVTYLRHKNATWAFCSPDLVRC